jgi:hypothetical protein
VLGESGLHSVEISANHAADFRYPAHRFAISAAFGRFSAYYAGPGKAERDQVAAAKHANSTTHPARWIR